MRWLLTAVSLTLLAILVGCRSPEAEVGAEDESEALLELGYERLSALELSVQLFHPEKGWGAVVRDTDYEFAVTRTPIESSNALEREFGRRGIVLDTDSLSVVYAMNPEIDASDIDEGCVLLLPRLQKVKRLRDALGQGNRIALVRDREMKQATTREITDLRRMLARIGALEQGAFEDAGLQSAVASDLESISETLGMFRTSIRMRSRPLETELLRQVHRETRVVSSLVRQANLGQRRIDAQAATTLHLIERDLSAKRVAFDEAMSAGLIPARSPSAAVEIHTLDSSGVKEVEGLRVYYVPQALDGEPEFIEAFGELSSPTVERLPVADYFIWAGRPGDPTPLTEKLPLEARTTDTIDLALLE